MISVVICSRDLQAYDLVSQNLRRTVGNTPLEIIRIDNSESKMGICEAYNLGIERAKGSVIIFQHEDVFHLELNWGPKLLAKFETYPKLGVLGVAGTQVLMHNPPLWSWAGRPWLFGKVVHELDAGERFFMTVFSPESGDREVVAVDGCMFAVRRKALDSVRFDAKTFPDFHFYDLDICMQLREHWSIMVSTDFLIKHRSAGSFSEEWKAQARQFQAKWVAHLPATVGGMLPPQNRGTDFYNVDLKGKVPQMTLI
jgi:GT2 family glycosyltransferase